ncbi:MAG: AraC family transcriptional regulator [Bacteroidota bacterium]
MEQFFKYVNPGKEDKEWGLYVNCVGKADIKPGVVYPPIEHPTGYYFKYEHGRVLYEYQINYITGGSGIFEDKGGIQKFNPGSLIFIKPGEWHRYRPLKNGGYMEHYVGFFGYTPNLIFGSSWFKQRGAVVEVGHREEIIDIYYTIFREVQEEKPGYQQVVSGMVLKLLGLIVSLEKRKSFSGKPIEKIIQNACFLIRENVETEINFKDFAEENNIGYSYFRKSFKQYTGIPPAQYHLNLKVLRAKEMLLYSNKSVKEISYDLGFNSVSYFCRIFKVKQGVSPTGIRHKPNVI